VAIERAAQVRKARVVQWNEGVAKDQCKALQERTNAGIVAVPSARHHPAQSPPT
jgi:hypothetical protein